MTVIDNLNKVIEVFFFFHRRNPRVIGFSPTASMLVQRGLDDLAKERGLRLVRGADPELPPGAFAVVKGIELHTISDLPGECMVIES